MAESTETKTQVAPAGNAASSSDAAVSNAGSDSLQTVEPTVDKAIAEGKSASSDDDSGAAGDGERRPGRAERRISELSSKIKELETQLGEQNQLATSLNKAAVDPTSIKFPDYSQMSEITPDQLKADIIKTAEQIVDLKMTAAGTALEQRLTTGQAVEKSATAIEAAINKYPALNPNSDDYDKDLDVEITDAYAAVLQRDPSYSFTKFIKPFERILEPSDTTDAKASTSKTEPTRGRSANRSTTPVRRSNEFPETGTAADMEKWFAQNRG